MAVLQASRITRKFIYEKDGNKIILPDFNANATPEQIVKFYSGQYPELTNASIEAPEWEGETMTFNIGTTVGTKG